MAIRRGFRRANIVHKLPAPPKVPAGKPLPGVIRPTVSPVIMQAAPYPISKRNQFGHLLTSLGLNGEAAEIGVAEGGFSFTLLSTWKGRLHMIDCWEHLTEGYKDGCNVPTDSQEWRYQQVLQHAAKYGDRAIVYRMFSADAADLFVPDQLDFVYIDANHAYPFIVADLAAWWPKLKKGGIFAGHDYLDGEHGGSDYGVKQAVTEFAAAHNLEVHVLPEQWPSWYARK